MAKKKTPSTSHSSPSGSLPVRRKASIFSDPPILPPNLIEGIESLEKATGKDVWFLLEGDFSIRHYLFPLFRKKKSDLDDRDVILIIDSFGGETDD